MYFVPPPFVAALFVASAFSFALASARRTAVLMLGAAAIVYASWWHDHYFDEPCLDPTNEISVLEWNVARGRGVGWTSIADYVAKADADVVGLVEAGHSNREQHEFWSDRFPDHQVVLPGGGLVLLVRGTVESTRFRQLLGISSMLSAEVVVNGRAILVVLVDLDASPRFDKRRLNDAILALAQRDRRYPAVVMGDFNTPIDSRWFRPFRATLTHAFEAAGSGLITTWPAGFPLLAVDHIWATPDLIAACARIEDTGLSDHRSFRAVFALPRPD